MASGGTRTTSATVPVLFGFAAAVFLGPKSDNKPLCYEKEHELEWIRQQANPFLLCGASPKAGVVELYSTWNRLNGFLRSGAQRVELVPGGPSDNCGIPATAEDRSLQRIPLGRPIVRASVDDLKDEATTTQLARALRAWVDLDRENIVNEAGGMFWVSGPREVRNEPRPRCREAPDLLHWAEDLRAR